MFKCGVHLGLCKLILAIFDVTAAIPCIGDLVGHSVRETRGVREGAVEFPHMFNMYIDPLRDRLLQQQPHLCKLMHITVALLLYADDAAIPADSIADLQRSAAIMEEFCNDSHLTISISKTFVTVFHADSDGRCRL